ncbi:MAG: yajO7 [Thermoleophilia bacterium]|nr:yajO7 [Thermoleophilia bacterium]
MTITTHPTHPLGSSGLEVSQLCLGGNVFGWTIDEAASFTVLDAYRAGGGTFIDTADAYSTWGEGNVGGESETIIGRWLVERAVPAGEIVVATKVGSPMPEGKGLAPAYVCEAAERSRERLGVETIDLLYAHRPDDSTPIADTLAAFHELVEAGTVRAIGLSNFTAAQTREALDAADANGLTRPVALQPEYNLVDRSGFEGELQALAVAEGLAVAPYYSLASGFLTGKYRPGYDAPESKRASAVLARYDKEQHWELLERLHAVADRHDATMAQVALAWLAAQPSVVAPIASGTSPAQVVELLRSVSLELDGNDLSLLR